MFRKLAAGALVLACMAMPARTEAPCGRVYSQMEPVGLYSTTSVMLNYRIEGNPDGRVVQKILDSLENIPDAIQEKFNRAGGTVVIVDRIPFDADDIKEFKDSWKILQLADEKDIDAWLGIKIAGYYKRKTKEAFVDYEKIGPAGTAVHEVGHGVDRLFGKFSESKEFAYAGCAAYAPAVKCDGTPLMDASQEFAYGFQSFYASGNTRLMMKKRNPELYFYFLDLEKKLMK